MSRIITVNSLAYDRSIKRTWSCRFLGGSDERIELLGEFERDVDHPELGTIRAGTASLEYFWPDRWYNVFRFSEPTGELKCHYINVAMPPEIANDRVEFVDLDVDIMVEPDGKFRILDLDELALNSVRFDYGPELTKTIDETIEAISERLRGRGIDGLIG